MNKRGYKILIDYGIKENLARFTITHGNWKNENLKIENLIVSLADKIWKRQRIDKLEEKVIAEISILTNIYYWTVYLKIDNIIPQIINDSDERLNWKSNVEILKVLDKHINASTIDNYEHFVLENPKYWQQTESRMISYWNEYYRRQSPRLKDYSGRHIVDRIKKRTHNGTLPKTGRTSIK